MCPQPTLNKERDSALAVTSHWVLPSNYNISLNTIFIFPWKYQHCVLCCFKRSPGCQGKCPAGLLIVQVIKQLSQMSLCLAWIKIQGSETDSLQPPEPACSLAAAVLPAPSLPSFPLGVPASPSRFLAHPTLPCGNSWVRGKLSAFPVAPLSAGLVHWGGPAQMGTGASTWQGLESAW